MLAWDRFARCGGVSSKRASVKSRTAYASSATGGGIDAVPIALVDVHYLRVGARAARVVADNWLAATGVVERTVTIPEVKAYKAGSFLERELPCLTQVLALATPLLGAVVVDGYVTLDGHGSPGLGAHLFESLGALIPVIGLVKRPYRGSSFAARVVRGSGRAPLFVTARGLNQTLAARLVAGMHGEHRIPTLAKRADRLARGLAEPHAAR